MAGKKRFAAKLLSVTIVLAAGGAGAYHFTTGGAWPQLLAGRADGVQAQLLADPARQLSVADLDAVTSSWASSPPARADAPAIDRSMTPTARSADATRSRPTVAPAAPPVSSRYAINPSTPTPVDIAKAEIAVAEDDAPTRSPDADHSAPPDENEPPLADPDVVSASFDDPSESSLARGQDPDDEEVETDETATSETANTPDLASEPRALELPASVSKADATSRRAREAFGVTPSALPASNGTLAPVGKGAAGGTATPAGGRYATTPPAASGARRALTEPGQSQSSGLVNPFSSPSTPAPTAVPAVPGSTEPRELGDALAKESGDPLNAPPAAAVREGPLPRDTAGSNPTPTRAANDGYRTGVQPDSEFQSLPSTSSRPSNPISYGSGGEPSAVDGTGKPGERALEGPQKPALAIQKFGPPEIQVGKPAKFAVQVRNIGTQTAEDVVIRDEVPQGTRLVSTSPTAESDGSQVVWRLGKLSVGDERTVEMQLMPTTEGEIGSVATVTHSTQASIKTRCTMPQLAIRMTAPSEVMIGAEQRVKIELRNPGSGDATGVMLFENVPANVRHEAGPALEFEIGTLRAGETRELELVLLAEKAGKVVNVLSARAEGNLQVQQQVEFEVIAPALSVEVNGPERRYLERPATYEVTVENPGTAAAHDVQLITKLPKGLRFVRANNMGEYDAASHAVYWSLAELPEGERGTVELVAMPIETGPQTLEVEGKAQQGLTDQAQQQIVVEGLAAIMFEVRDLEDPIEVGGETGYEIRVVNQGTKAAANVKVAVNLPPGMQVLSADGETRHAVESGSILFEPLDSLAPKADTVYRVKVQGVQAGDQRVTVEVKTDDLGQPIRREESTRVFGDE